MESVEPDGLLTLLAMQRKPKRYGGRPPKRRLKYEKFLDKQRADSRRDVLLNADFKIDYNQEIWLYDHAIGNYFCFADIFEAKFTVEMSINKIFDLLEITEYKPGTTRRFVFAYSKQECENRVQSVYCENNGDSYENDLFSWNT